MSRTRMAERNPESRGVWKDIFWFLRVGKRGRKRLAQTRIRVFSSSSFRNRMKGGNKWFDYVDRSIDVLNSTPRRKKTTVEQIFFLVVGSVRGASHTLIFFSCLLVVVFFFFFFFFLSFFFFVFYSLAILFFLSNLNFYPFLSVPWFFVGGGCVCVCAAARRWNKEPPKMKIKNFGISFQHFISVLYAREHNTWPDGSVRPAAKTYNKRLQQKSRGRK